MSTIWPKNYHQALVFLRNTVAALSRLGGHIRIARKRRALTLEEMASRMFVTRKTLSRLEHGDPGVSLAMSVGARGREASLGNALSGARRFGLSGEEAGTVAEQLVETVRGWRDHFAAVGCPEVELRALEPSLAR